MHIQALLLSRVLLSMYIHRHVHVTIIRSRILSISHPPMSDAREGVRICGICSEEGVGQDSSPFISTFSSRPYSSLRPVNLVALDYPSYPLLSTTNGRLLRYRYCQRKQQETPWERVQAEMYFNAAVSARIVTIIEVTRGDVIKQFLGSHSCGAEKPSSGKVSGCHLTIYGRRWMLVDLLVMLIGLQRRIRFQTLVTWSIVWLTRMGNILFPRVLYTVFT